MDKGRGKGRHAGGEMCTMRFTVPIVRAHSFGGGHVVKNADVDDRDVVERLVVLVALDVLDHLDDVHPLDAPPEDRVLVIEPGRRHGRDEKLRAVGVGPCDRHG